MANFIVPNIICFQTQKQFTTLNNIGVLVKDVLIDLRAHNSMHVKNSLHAGCMYARDHACDLLSPSNIVSGYHPMQFKGKLMN